LNVVSKLVVCFVDVSLVFALSMFIMLDVSLVLGKPHILQTTIVHYRPS